MFGTIDCSHTTLQWAAHGAKGTVVRSEAEYAISLFFRITIIYLTYESESSQGWSRLLNRHKFSQQITMKCNSKFKNPGNPGSWFLLCNLIFTHLNEIWKFENGRLPSKHTLWNFPTYHTRGRGPHWKQQKDTEVSIGTLGPDQYICLERTNGEVECAVLPSFRDKIMW